MQDQRFSADLPSLGDLNIDLDKADQVAESPTPEASDTEELPDIPVEDEAAAESPATETKEENTTSDGLDLDMDFSTEPAAGSPTSSPDDSSKKQDAIEKVINQIDKATFETEMATMKTFIAQLQSENEVVNSRLRDLKSTFDDYVLFRIPKYQEIDLPASKHDPEYLIPHIGNALDKQFIKIFKDVPKYHFRSFEIMEKDDDGNIVNALLRVGVEFHESSPFNFLKFDLELWIIGGVLNIPGWFVYNKNVHTLSEQGVRSIAEVSNRMHQIETTPMEKTQSWYNVNKGQQNPVIPHQVDIPMSTHNTQNVWRTHRQF